MIYLQMLINSLWFGMNADESIHAKTLTDKLYQDDKLKIEHGFDQVGIDPFLSSFALKLLVHYSTFLGHNRWIERDWTQNSH